MSDPAPRPGPGVPMRVTTASQKPAPKEDAMPCDRCGTEMFRMHAVWRCPNCGFKSDCCGW